MSLSKVSLVGVVAVDVASFILEQFELVSFLWQFMVATGREISAMLKVIKSLRIA